MSLRPTWIDAFETALNLPQNKGKVVYQLATVDADNAPRVRTVGYKSVLYPAGAPHLPVLLVIADVRTAKVAQTRANDRAEIAWHSASTHEQFRIAGRVRVVPGPTHPLYADALKDAPLALRTMQEQGFDWEGTRAGVFRDLPARFKANYCRPPPGDEMVAYEKGLEWPVAVPKVEGAEDEEDRGNYEWGLSNISLFLLEVTEVDYVAIAGRPHKRTKFVRSEGGVWSEKILVP